MKKNFVTPKTITPAQLAGLRRKLSLTQENFAELINVSVSTVRRWEQGNEEISGPVTPLFYMLLNNNTFAKQMEIPPLEKPLRLKYMFNDLVCTIIDVDDREKEVSIINYVKFNDYRAFGANEHPTYSDYNDFLESRCFPRSRDKMKLELKKLNLPFYDPMLIIEKTEGRMAEDNFYIRIERK